MVEFSPSLCVFEGPSGYIYLPRLCRINQRTGRVLLDDPKPPPPESYLDMPIIKLGLDKLAAVPELPENLYQRPIGAILNWTFPVLEGFSAARGGWNSLTIPDFTFTKVEQVPKGRAKNWEVLLVESKALGHPWGSAYDQLVNAWEVNTNDSKNVYGMIHIGMDIKFYKFESGQVQELTGKLHLINDAKEITDRLVWIKQNPLSFDE